MSSKVLIIDDSALMRKHLRQILESGGYQVDTARNGQEGLDKIQTFDPAVVSLDINMPVMDGITCLSMIMQQQPRPVVMVSSLTDKGALATFEALELGAIDYVAKPGGTVSLNMSDIADELLDKIKSATRMKVSRGQGLRTRLRMQREQAEAGPRVKPLPRFGRQSTIEAILIGVSTGGPGTIEEIVHGLPADFPVPIVVAQHMPQRFTQVFAERLNKSSGLTVKEVSSLTQLVPGEVLIAKGDADIKLVRRGGKLFANSVPASPNFVWHPSVERLVDSAEELIDPKNMICVQMTGMGNDGAQAMARVNKKGTKTLAESEETAVVFGMPRELIEAGGADLVLPSYRVADQLIKWVK